MVNHIRNKQSILPEYTNSFIKKEAFIFIIMITAIVILSSLVGCRSAEIKPDSSDLAASSAVPRQADDFMIVDCMLPGQVRKLGRMTYLTKRRPIKTTALDCEIRGGEYVAYDRASYSSALEVWLNLAVEGDRVAQTHVGEIYMKGLVGPPKYDMAAKWFQKAADQGYDRARLSLGYLYEMGLGVPKDPVKALNLYRVATGLEENVVLASETIDIAEKEEMKRLRQEVKRLRQETELLKQSLKETSKQKDQRLEEHRRQIQRLESERNALNRAKQELAKLRAQLTAQKLEKPSQTDHTAELEKLKKELASREAELEDQRKKTLELQNNITHLDREVLSYQNLMKENSRTEDLQAELENQRTEAQRLKEKLNAAMNDEKQLREELESRKRQLNERQKELAATRKKLETAQQNIEIVDQHDIEMLKKELSLRENALSKERENARQISVQMEAVLSDVEDYKQQIKEFDTLKSKMEQQISENKELKALLQKTREEKARLAKDFKWMQEHIEAERCGLEKARKSLEVQKDEILSARNDRLLELEAEITQRQREVEKQKNQEKLLRESAEQLAEKVALYEKRLEDHQKKMEGLAGPTIKILDPKLAKTRGKKPETRVETDLDNMEIIGKVNAPAGLYSLKINGQKKEWTDEGLFKVDLPVKKDKTSVKIVAVDSRGKAESMILTVIRGLSETPGNIPKLDFGRYYALIIGNENYTEFPKLQTAANDARDIEKILRDKYGFETKLLIDVGRFEIHTQLDYFRRTLTEKDNFLLYYAGHGELDRKNRRGYWLPVDASPESHVNSIPNYAITDILNSMSVRQGIVIADTCYSGSLTRSVITQQMAGMSDQKKIEWLKNMATKRSRTVLSSGGLKPVLDAGTSEHSIFAHALLDLLVSNEDILEASRLYSKIRSYVSETSKRMGLEQTPQYAANIHAGHESGDFLFVPLTFQKSLSTIENRHGGSLAFITKSLKN